MLIRGTIHVSVILNKHAFHTTHKKITRRFLFSLHR